MAVALQIVSPRPSPSLCVREIPKVKSHDRFPDPGRGLAEPVPVSIFRIYVVVGEQLEVVQDLLHTLVEVIRSFHHFATVSLFESPEQHSVQVLQIRESLKSGWLRREVMI